MRMQIIIELKFWKNEKVQESPSCVSSKYEQKHAYTTGKYTNETTVGNSA